MDVIPNTWEMKTPIEAKKSVLIFRPYFGPTQTRSFGAGDPSHDWELGSSDSARDDYIEIKHFWDDHFPGIQFYLYDVELDETRVYEIISDFSGHYNTPDSYAWSFRISECYPFTVIAGSPPP
jgi:hypothetical protein